ncbi:Putative anti-sigma factor antagonist [Myxococcaceae bacterium]|jgi:anti-sigma B factor antagonist|nr:Putative anti-sigma factor antagonist [Myxococcaceae bacterium]
MDFACQAFGPVDVITFAGKLDASNGQRVREGLKDHVANGRPFLVIDLSDVGFVDSTGLSALVSAFKISREHAGEVVLAGLRPPVRTLVELTRLHHVFRIYATAQDAVSDLGSRAVSGSSAR